MNRISCYMFHRCNEFFMLTQNWNSYFKILSEIYIVLYYSRCLFSLNEPFSKGNPSRNYRGVFWLNDDQVSQIEPLLEEGKRLYMTATDGGSRFGMPANFPRFIDDDSVFKMQIHINKAHLSKNYEADTMLKIATVPTLVLDGEDEKAIKADIKLFHEVAETLDNLGYEVKIENLPSHDFMYVRVKQICEKFGCSSIQHRIDTGRQIRANFFSHDADGFINKSRLQSVGILLIPPTQAVTVLSSLDRKIRNDAIYTKRHPTEIIIDAIPEKFLTGRMYRR